MDILKNIDNLLVGEITVGVLFPLLVLLSPVEGADNRQRPRDVPSSGGGEDEEDGTGEDFGTSGEEEGGGVVPFCSVSFVFSARGELRRRPSFFFEDELSVFL